MDKHGMEHVVANWLPRYLGQENYLLQHAQAKNVPRRKMIKFGEYKAKILCGECNRYMGREMEDKTRDLLIPMLDGVARTYNPEEQAQLARWCFKTTCTMLGRERKLRAVPQVLRHRFRKTGEVPPSCFVGIGRYTSGGVRLFAGRLRLIPGRGVPEDPVLSVYHSVMAFGQCAIKVFGVLKPPPEDTFRIPVGRLYRIWPPERDEAKWPPLWSFDDDGIDELAVFNPFIRR